MKDLLTKINSQDGEFHNGNPATGEQGTRVTAEWLNDVQDHIRDFGVEVKYLLAKAAMEPNDAKKTQLYDAIIKIINDNRQRASLTNYGETKLYSGYDSNSEELAATPKAVKTLKDFIDSINRNFSNYITNSKKSSAVNSDSEDTVATSKAVKTAYDKSVEAVEIANLKQSPATTLNEYGIADFKVVEDIENRDLDDIVTVGLYGQAHNSSASKERHYPENFAGSLVVLPSAYKTMQEYTIYNSGNKYVRNKQSNGTWSEWIKVGKEGVSIGSIIAFPKEISNPDGFLKCDGSTFSSETYPDLYQMLGNKNKLPNLNRSDVGMLAYFPQNEVPVGWLACDGSTISSTEYPELHRYLNNKYGANKLPDAEDRFIRNAGNGLQVGETQGDAIRNIKGNFGPLDNDNKAEMESMLDGPFYYIEGNYWGLGTDWNGNNPLIGFDLSRVVPTAEENRPKSIVFKLCIKAKNQFDDVAFWIKAFGEVTNLRELDASKLAQDIQAVRSEKSDLHHTHRTRDIIDFNDDVSSIIHNLFTQDFSENGWVKLPNGLIFQWGKVKKGYDHVSEEQRVISFPIVFPHKCIHVSLTEFSSSWSYQTTIESRRDLTRAGVKIVSQRNDTTFFAVGY